MIHDDNVEVKALTYECFKLTMIKQKHERKIICFDYDVSYSKHKKDMKNIDLNICLSYFQEPDEYDIVYAIDALVKNEWASAHPFNCLNKITIKYDAPVQTLKIINNYWSIRASDFMQTTYLPRDGHVLLSGIISLMKGNFNLEFTSKFGKFTPFIDQKTSIDYPVASLYVKCEEPLANQANWAKVKHEYNEDEDDDNNCTIITISPVDEVLVQDLKEHFSFTQDWQKVIEANGDYLLVNDLDKPNKIFVDGIAKEFTQDTNPQLLYSYDISSNFTSKVKNSHSNDWYMQRAICIILYNLSDEAKKHIYPTILNNEKCLEWTYPEVQRIILDFLNKQAPNKYVIYKDSSNPAEDVLQIVKEAGKIIVPVDASIMPNLTRRMHDVYECMQTEVGTKYSNAGLANEDLSPIEQNNLQLLKEFLNYFANHFEELRQWLTNHHVKEVPIDVVENYPTNWGTYSPELEKAIIDRSVLCDSGTTFNCGFTIMWRMISTGYDYEEFISFWWENAVNFLTSKNTNHQNAVQMLTESNNKNKQE